MVPELSGGGADLAVVTYLAPHGTDAVKLREGDASTFGRGAECRIRFGYAPTADEGLPRVAGTLRAAGGRIFIESQAQPGHRAIEVAWPSGSTVIPSGEGFSPKSRHFDVVVRGGQTWKLSVVVRQLSASVALSNPADPPTNRLALDLSNKQLAVLQAYCGSGRAEPATHRQVAATLSYHPNTVREMLYEIWSLMFELQVPMPDVSDKRVAVCEAARLHGLLCD